MIHTDKQTELELNFQAFTQVLPTLLPAYEGKYALMRHGEVVEYFDSPGDALKSARENFPDGLFSVQTITSAEADFGWYSNAPDSRDL